ncbi:MAG: hypothetical protein KGZ58_08720 [Ignavibacteriales bacterium]|nr:hypothetical protein [Ignavibacteriales bacterium]
MSLKTFHIFFISLSVLTAIGFGVWLLNENAPVFAVLSFLSGIGLIVYGISFLRKLKHVSFI